MSEQGESGWLPPEAPGAHGPARWDSHLPAAAPPPPPAPPAQRPPAWSHPPPPPAWTQPPPPPPWSYPSQPANGHAIAALVLGIAGVATFLVFLGLFFFVNLPCSILAVIFGVSGKRRVDRGETAQHRSLAQAGFVLGVAGVVLGVLGLIAWGLILALG